MLSLIPVADTPLSDWSDKAQHIFAFVVLSFLVDASWPAQEMNRTKITLVMLYGLAIEIMQLGTGYRYFAINDLFANAAGIAGYCVSRPLLKKVPLVRWRWTLR